MNTSEQILVIILSVFLALFLGLAIAAAISVIKLVQSLRRIADKAEHVIDSAESVGSMLRKASTPVSFFHFVRGVAETVAHHKSNDKGDK